MEGHRTRSRADRAARRGTSLSAAWHRSAAEHPCGATSQTTGRPCRQVAIPGGTVCRYHGGRAPQVIAAAQARLAALVEPAITRVGQLVRQQRQPAVALAAARDVLDRAVGRAVEVVEHRGEMAVELTRLSDAELRARVAGLLARSTEAGCDDGEPPSGA